MFNLPFHPRAGQVGPGYQRPHVQRVDRRQRRGGNRGSMVDSVHGSKRAERCIPIALVDKAFQLGASHGLQRERGAVSGGVEERRSKGAKERRSWRSRRWMAELAELKALEALEAWRSREAEKQSNNGVHECMREGGAVGIKGYKHVSINRTGRRLGRGNCNGQVLPPPSTAPASSSGFYLVAKGPRVRYMQHVTYRR